MLLGGSMVANSPDEVRVRAREQLLQGASQIKLTAAGASRHRTALGCLDLYLTTVAGRGAGGEKSGHYVTIQAYTSVAIQRALRAGIKIYKNSLR
ncbi:MAG: hypothetical protein ABI537_07875 [Casimicrobiaceae bacterium]